MSRINRAEHALGAALFERDAALHKAQTTPGPTVLPFARVRVAAARAELDAARREKDSASAATDSAEHVVPTGDIVDELCASADAIAEAEHAKTAKIAALRAARGPFWPTRKYTLRVTGGRGETLDAHTFDVVATSEERAWAETVRVSRVYALAVERVRVGRQQAWYEIMRLVDVQNPGLLTVCAVEDHPTE